MAIWGKVVGGIAGFWLGGPLGALLGVGAAHIYGKLKGESGPAPDWAAGAPFGPEAARRQAAFATALVVLGAKMAKADGQVTEDEIRAFRQVFRVPDSDEAAIGQIFNEAKRDHRGFEPYAEQLAAMFAHDRPVLEEFMDALFHIAKADGSIHAREMDYLKKVAAIFGFHAHDFERIHARHVPQPNADPYKVLGVAPGISDADLKKTYRDLVRENHPDRLVAQGMPEEMVKIANEKMAVINAAYDVIKKQRGF